jgi:hypothetical protein
MPQHHSTAPRGAELAPKSEFVEGRFGRMFRSLPALAPSEQALIQLGERMLEPEEAGEELDGPIPAGYTYLGQFIDHDITFDPVSSLQRLHDPDGLHDFRTPRLDLDSLYGDGPNNDPYLYDPNVDEGRTSFLIGENGSGERDLPRNRLPNIGELPQGRALTGDPRNDENIIVAQLHLLFLRFHNKVVEHLKAQGMSTESAKLDLLFEEAQRVVRWHYQWIVVQDFLRRICGDGVVDDILRPETYGAVSGEVSIPRIKLQFYSWRREPFMPVEFSVAAYRFGHSMIRPSYRLNPQTPPIPIFSDGDLQNELQDLRGFRPLAPSWTISWDFFFGAGAGVQHARKIDTKLAPPLQKVPATNPPHHALAIRNLLRSRSLSVPSGQRVARAMAMEPMSDETLDIVSISEEFTESAPLWFYVLKEAEAGSGGQLGPVGGRIVAEVLLGLIKGDPFSFLNVEPSWKPTLGEASGQFSMDELVAFVEGREPPPPPPPSPGWPPS